MNHKAMIYQRDIIHLYIPHALTTLKPRESYVPRYHSSRETTSSRQMNL